MSRHGADHSAPAGPTGDARQRTLDLLEHSPLLTALLDGEGRVLHANAALRAETELPNDGMEDLTGLLTDWSATKLREAALPAAQAWGLWEGGLTLARPQGRATAHATLVGSTVPEREDAVLALLTPHFGPVVSEGEHHGDLPDLSTRLAVPLHQETRLLAPADITHLEAHGPYTQIYLTHKALFTSLRLARFEASLPDAFVRSHRSYLVNIQRVHSLVRHDGRLFLCLDSPAAPEVPVSRRREPPIRDILETAQQVKPASE